MSAGAAGAGAAAAADPGERFGEQVRRRFPPLFSAHVSDPASAQVPYGDPPWYQGLRSPHYGPSHAAFRARVRAFVDTELLPHVGAWDEAGAHPPELRRKAYAAGLLGACWPAEHGGTPPEGFDAFHDLILVDELARCAAGGVLWSCFFSFSIALPPILHEGSDYLKLKVARPVITGEKVMSLAVTEPYAGSDVANLRCSARLSACGTHYVVNGEKKWITSGCSADFFTVAVRTGGPGAKGISLLLVERETPGVETVRMKTMGWWMSNTAFVTFSDVKVPVANLIGEENGGFRAIMYNFSEYMLAAAPAGAED